MKSTATHRILNYELRISNYELRNLSLTCNSGGDSVIRNCMQCQGLIRACMKTRESAHQVRNFGDRVWGCTPSLSSRLYTRIFLNPKLISRIPYPCIPYLKFYDNFATVLCARCAVSPPNTAVFAPASLMKSAFSYPFSHIPHPI